MSHSNTTPADKIALTFVPVNAAASLSSTVAVWLLDLAAIDAGESAKLAALVSDDERARAQDFKRNQHHFLATRALLRSALAQSTDLAAAQLQFARTEQGKPFLTNAPHPIYFNLTHSGNFAALAISAQGDIGVDLEVIRPRNYLAIAERYFHADELAQLLALEDAARERLFFQLWTLKEAFFKATGGGISSGLDKAVFNLRNNQIAAHFSASLHVQETEWQFQQEFIAPSALVALALKAEQPIQHQWFDGNSLLAGK